MKKDEYERLFQNFPRIGKACFSFSLRNFELHPNTPFSRAVAFASICYVFFHLLDSFARAKNPRSMIFNHISIFFGIAVLVIALARRYRGDFLQLLQPSSIQ